tara:strand:+ start:401 stop:556 length:156 start_codon:yes stop_codon:yes gene_type:complete
MQNPYEPPKEYKQERLPKYEEPLIDWTGVIIILGALSVVIAFTLVATIISK